MLHPIKYYYENLRPWKLMQRLIDEMIVSAVDFINNKKNIEIALFLEME